MTDEEIVGRLHSRVEGLNEMLEAAKAAGLRVRIASLVEKEYDHTDRVVLQDVTKSMLPKRTPIKFSLKSAQDQD